MSKEKFQSFKRWHKKPSAIKSEVYRSSNSPARGVDLAGTGNDYLKASEFLPQDWAWYHFWYGHASVQHKVKNDSDCLQRRWLNMPIQEISGSFCRIFLKMLWYYPISNDEIDAFLNEAQKSWLGADSQLISSEIELFNADSCWFFSVQKKLASEKIRAGQLWNSADLRWCFSCSLNQSIKSMKQRYSVQIISETSTRVLLVKPDK